MAEMESRKETSEVVLKSLVEHVTAALDGIDQHPARRAALLEGANRDMGRHLTWFINVWWKEGR